jgi:hypothetical protein
MSGRSTEFPRDLAHTGEAAKPGAQLAVCKRSRRSRLGLGQALAFCGVTLLGACLVTDPVEFEDEKNEPPVIFEAVGPDGVRIPLGSVITTDNPISTGNGGGGQAGAPSIPGNNELELRLRIRDENLSQALRARVRIRKPNNVMIPYQCPEPEILPNGTEVREYEFGIDKTALDISTCHRVEIVVSSRFSRCNNSDPEVADELFDETFEDDDLAYASFWIWETSMDPLASPEAALLLAKSCETLNYGSETTTPPTGL